MMACTKKLAEGTVIVLPLAPTSSSSSSSSEKKNVFSSRAAGFGMEFIKGVRYVAELMEPTNGDVYLCGDINGSDGNYTGRSSSGGGAGAGGETEGGGGGEGNSGEAILQDVTPSHPPGFTAAGSAVPGG